jgi:hypothetical protein
MISPILIAGLLGRHSSFPDRVFNLPKREDKAGDCYHSFSYMIFLALKRVELCTGCVPPTPLVRFLRARRAFKIS